MPIQLTGVVSASNAEEDKLLQSTHLPTVFKLRMPYKTLDGNPTLLKIAIGNNIAVNIILGYLFIKSIKMTIDVADNIAESKELNAIFQMEAKVLIKVLLCHIPDHAR
eukprot:9925320-Ditylum_brightwellii.AAC.2